MKIKRLTLRNYRRFTHFEIDFDEQLTVLVAKNGEGKSTILDAVATSLGVFLTRLPRVTGLDPKISDFHVSPDGHRPPYMRITCETDTGFVWDRTERRDQTKETAGEIPPERGVKELYAYVDQFIDAEDAGADYQLPIFIYFGTGRGVFEMPLPEPCLCKPPRRFDALHGALENRTNFKGFMEYFYALGELEARAQERSGSPDVELPELKAIRRAVSSILPDFSNPQVVDQSTIQVDWRQETGVKQLKIEQLSNGHRMILVLVMDIAARMVEANPEMADPLQTEGIVLIDEVDLHLHPSWQQVILLDLMKTFPRIQFIVTTHSPQVVSAVDPRSLRVIDWREDQPSLVPVGFSAGAEAQQVLLQVLGVESSRVQQLEVVQKLKRYQALVDADKWDCEEALELRRELDLWGGEHEPELACLDMDIRMREMDRCDEEDN